MTKQQTPLSTHIKEKTFKITALGAMIGFIQIIVISMVPGSFWIFSGSTFTESKTTYIFVKIVTLKDKELMQK